MSRADWQRRERLPKRDSTMLERADQGGQALSRRIGPMGVILLGRVLKCRRRLDET
jgi:hypothetical protein